MLSLSIANNWAKKSCPKWNKNRSTRKIYRWLYRKLAERYCKSFQGRNEVFCYRYLSVNTNTYPWPYNDENFANWDESDDKENYNLISDQSGCVVKYATSYCAYKIYEATGKWPQKTSPERLDANRWQQFLAEAGYTKIVEKPDFGNSYVGIKPDEGEWGLVVWFDKIFGDFVVVSTYIDKKYTQMYIDDPEKYTWVKIQ